MIKVDIVNEVSKVADITKVKAEVAVDAVFDAMRLSMQRGERIELRGFGVFQVKPRKRGIGRNPRTGKEVRIPPGRTIRFKPGQGSAEYRGVTPFWSPFVERPLPSAPLLSAAEPSTAFGAGPLWRPPRPAPALSARSLEHVLLFLLTLATTTLLGQTLTRRSCRSSAGGR